jgi:hypothetical protein
MIDEIIQDSYYLLHYYNLNYKVQKLSSNSIDVLANKPHCLLNVEDPLAFGNLSDPLNSYDYVFECSL